MARRRRVELTAERWRRLDHLDEEARRLVERARREWLGHALATAPADRPAAEEAIGRLYQLAGYGLPRFVWVDSPAGALLAIWLLGGGLGVSYRRGLLVSYQEVFEDPLWEVVGDRLRDSLWAALEGPLGRALRRPGQRPNLLAKPQHRSYPGADSIGRRLGALRAELTFPSAAARALVRNPVTRPLPLPDQIELLLREALTESLRVPLRDAYRSRRGQLRRRQRDLWRLLWRNTLGDYALERFRRDCWGGPREANRCCIEDLVRRLGAVAYPPEDEEFVDLVATVTRSCGPWWPYPSTCIVNERPSRLHVEPSGRAGSRLHHPEEPALAWRDGFAIHAWHGVAVPERVLTEELTIEDWLGEPNAEVRRVMAERMGYDWLLDNLRADNFASDEYGTLWRVWDPLGPDEVIVLVEVLNSTPEPDGSRRRYVLRVPPDQTVPRDAIGWTFGLAPGTYEPTLMT